MCTVAIVIQVHISKPFLALIISFSSCFYENTHVYCCYCYEVYTSTYF